MRNLALILSVAFIVAARVMFTPLTVKQVVQAEYRTWYVYSDGHVRGYSNNGGSSIKQWQEPAGTWTKVTAAFNFMNCLDASGYVWQSRTFNIDPKDSFWRVDVDTLGNPFSGNFDVTYFSTVNMTLRADSTPWYWGNDVYNFFYTGGNLATWVGQKMLPTQFSSLKLRKIVMGYTHLVGLSSDGMTVYEWVPGNRTPHQTINLPRPATDVFVAASDFWGYLIPDPTGSQTMGYPYVAGTATSLYGGGSAFTTPTSIKTLWGMTQPIKVFDVDWQTIHFIDSSGHLWGCGWNSFGEVGNGVEFVGRHTYQGGNFSYGWPLNNGENPSGIPVIIGGSTQFKSIASTNWFGTCKAAIDVNDSVYVWGRNKAGVLGWGGFMRNWTGVNPITGVAQSTNMDQDHYNAMDFIVPTRVTPLSAIRQDYDGYGPTLDAADQSITTSSTTIDCTGHLLWVISSSHPAANGIDTLFSTNLYHNWTQLSGPNTATLSNTNTKTVAASNLINGTYVFQDLVSDDRSGQDTVQTHIFVNIAATNQRIKYRFHHTVSRKI